MEKILIEETEDGSHTLYVPDLNEHYHSTHGAIQESNHIYINAGLKYLSKQNISVLEIGFGTGLNAYLTLLESNKSKVNIDYWGLESRPLSSCITNRINYPYLLQQDRVLFDDLHECEWGSLNIISAQFSLCKLKIDITSPELFSVSGMFDVIYYDAFAPDKQEKVWAIEIFDFLFKHTSKGGVLVTYCAKGEIRRRLQQVGYRVERLSGPKGKREILRAIKE